jgi:fumarate reductase flavoprotein subunit
MEADVIVIAAGLSGLAASISAAENGASVLTFEKSNTTGGAANMGMGVLGVGTKLQRKMMINLTPMEVFRRHMEFVHWRADARLVRDYYMKSAETIEWLEDMGVEFMMVMGGLAPENIKSYANPYPVGHIVKPEGGGPIGPRMAATMIKRLTERANELGVNIQFETPVKKILMEDGKAVGVLACDKNGEEIEARSGAVIIATGGAGDNPEFIKEYTGYEWNKNLYSFRIPGNVGDGLRMAWEAGADRTDIIMELMFVCPDNLNHWILDGAFRQPCLWVNQLGYRFMNEDNLHSVGATANAINAQPKHCAYSIMDTGLLKKYKKRGPDIQSYIHHIDLFTNIEEEAFEPALKEGYEHFFAADSIEELAEKTGINLQNLKETIEEYNECCEQNYDEVFEKDRKYLQPIKGPKYYCLRYFPGAYGTLGGIKIDHKNQVIRNECEVIPGLYAVGADACSIYGDCYPFVLGGNTMGFCLNTGRIAGENAVKYVNSLK